MNLPKGVLIICLLPFLYACPKKELQTAEISIQPAFRLRQMIVRESPASQRTIRFEYDSKNRLIRRSLVEGNRSLETFVYEDDELVTIVTYDANGAEAFSNDRPFLLSDFGTQLRLELDRPTSASARETVSARYEFEDGQITEIEAYFQSVNPAAYRSLNQYFTYDQRRNLSEYSTDENGQITVRYEVETVDTYKNPVRDLSILVYVFGDLPNFSGMGSHNVTSMIDNEVRREFEYTYNSANYPLTIRDKRESFNRYEFEYEN